MKSIRRALSIACLLLGATLLAFALWFGLALRPTPSGGPFFTRYNQATPLNVVLQDLEKRGAIRNAFAVGLFARVTGRGREVKVGTYRLRPGIGVRQALIALTTPIRQWLRLPENNWARRNANLLEKNQVCTAEEYLACVASPEQFKEVVSFPLPSGSLEGVLYPDTYDLPPLLGASAVVERQLKAFEMKVWVPLHAPKNLQRNLTVASLVQLEVTLDQERPIVAGVIENRLAKRMPLQIDATVLYARGKWGKLSIRELTSVDSPYNTYLHRGLPPGPICSPSLKSIKAAMHPARHDFLYYVAMPDGHQLFAKTLAEQNHNIRLRKAALAARKAQG